LCYSYTIFQQAPTLVYNCFVARRTEITEGKDSEEPHIKFLSRDGLSRAILKIEDAVK
jgi:hypothetical protein